MEKQRGRKSGRYQKLGGLSTNYLVELLETVSKGGLTFSQFYRNNPIIHKATFLKYVNWCMKKGMIDKANLILGNNEGYTRYTLTKKGELFLELLSR